MVAPFFTSFLLRTLAWRQILADEGLVVGTLKSLHLLGETTTADRHARSRSSPGMTYNFLPFMVLPLYASLERIDPRLIEAGGDLYANALTAFRKVTLPLSMPGVVAGTLLTFIPAAGDYVNAELLGNPNTTMIGNVIQSRFFTVVDYPTAAALSFLLMAAILVLVVLRPPGRHRGARVTTTDRPSSAGRHAGAPGPTLARRVRRWLGAYALAHLRRARVRLHVPADRVRDRCSRSTTRGRTNLAWHGFTLDDWRTPAAHPTCAPRVGNSLQIGLIATLVATALGTLVAFALARHRFRGRGSTNLLMFLPMATPEVVHGAVAADAVPRPSG